MRMNKNITRILLIIVFVVDNSDTNAYTGQIFNFSMQFTDNIATKAAVVEFWYGTSGTHFTRDLVKVGNDFKNTTVTIPNSLEPLNYFFNFTDTSDLWATTTIVQVPVTDNVKPDFIKGSGDTVSPYPKSTCNVISAFLI